MFVGSYWVCPLQAYWQQQRDVTDMNTLQEAVEPFGLTASKLLEDPVASRILRSNTAEAAGRGAFGVPGCVHFTHTTWMKHKLKVSSG